ncbi:SDR family oxidoreductase [Alicyclobacillaceae bacterium I2511]|nr:SDR family oxidoreductase [Alicyclobacillaceae bacterium I2511]
MSGILTGKNVLFMGAGPNMGRVMARLLAQAGARLHLVAKDGSAAAAVAQEIGENGGLATYGTADIADGEAVHKAVQIAAQQMGKIDILVNNAGTFHDPGVLLHETSMEHVRELLGVNVEGEVYTMQAVLPYMIKSGGGSILNIAAASVPLEIGNVLYAGARTALITASQRVARAYRSRQIRVNVLSPGMVYTANQTPTLGPVPHPEQGLYRPGAAEDIAWTALYLLSPDAAWVSGAVVDVDGAQSREELGR